jgi:cytoskeleton protein RodZ
VSESDVEPERGTPGRRLRRAREARGLSAAQAADLMRLSPAIVEAIEGDRYAELGAPVFARGHLRRYAALLGLPGDEMIEGYDHSHAGPAVPTLIPPASAHTPVRTPRNRRGVPAGLSYLLLALLLGGLLFASWWLWNHRAPVESVDGETVLPLAPEAPLAAPFQERLLGDDVIQDADSAAIAPEGEVE